jgi:hypothetical protein
MRHRRRRVTPASATPVNATCAPPSSALESWLTRHPLPSRSISASYGVSWTAPRDRRRKSSRQSAEPTCAAISGRLLRHPAPTRCSRLADSTWKAVLATVSDPRIQSGLSRFARWCSLSGISPEAVSEVAVDRFAQDIKARTLIRNADGQRGAVLTAWNRLIAQKPDLPAIATATSEKVLKPVP